LAEIDMLARMMDRVETALAEQTPLAASTAFFDAMRREGATYLQTRAYLRPAGRLSSTKHWNAGGLIVRISPEEWPASPGFHYVCFDNNPLLTAIRENRTLYRFSDFAPAAHREFGDYWDAYGQARIADALCATSYGAEGRIASLHLGFDVRAFDPAEAMAIQMAGLALTEKLMQLAAPAPDDRRPRLSSRERDALAFVAEGKTDWEISVIMGVSQTTARFHVDRGRRKLGAVKPAQAVAHLVSQRLI